jgi:5-deoxy-glucuronate isomerase
MTLPFHLRSASLPPGASGLLVEISPAAAAWRYVNFAVRQVAEGDAWSSSTGVTEVCLVLLEGECRVSWNGGEGRLGPRASVFSAYPHAVYLPPETSFTVEATMRTQLADCRAPADVIHPPRVVRPAECGFEIRGGGNATRQIVDILPPSFAAHRLLICEVYTPSGNWSSYPPHKHDADNPPAEVQLEETYYYRFNAPHAYGVQRLYGPDDRDEQTLTVRHGDLVLIRSGYHPFVSAHGYDAYYLNVLAGDRRSMAASDDPRYAMFRRQWPAPDPRLPVVRPPYVPNAMRTS